MAEILHLPDRLTPFRRALLRRQARVEADRLWSDYRHAMAELDRCPCDLHRAKAGRALRAWEPVFRRWCAL